MGSIEQRRFLVPYLALVGIGPLLLYWYPLDLLAVLTGSVSQGSFIAADKTNQVYFFTIAAAVVSVVVVSWSILKQERFKRAYLPLAILVAYVSTISVTMWYEQLYANLWDVYFHTSYWYEYYISGFIPGYGWVFIDMALVLVAYPWMRTANARLVAMALLLTLVSFTAWISVGYGRPNVSVLDYSLNASSRIFSQLTLVASVLPSRRMPRAS
jgi:hypothetical protein